MNLALDMAAVPDLGLIYDVSQAVEQTASWILDITWHIWFSNQWNFMVPSTIENMVIRSNDINNFTKLNNGYEVVYVITS
jgi:hypothetical protein